MDNYLVKNKHIEKMVKILIIGLYFLTFIALMTTYSMKSGEIAKQSLVQSYIEAYKEEDLQKLGELFYRKNSKRYQDFLIENEDVFLTRKNHALQRAEYFELWTLWYNPQESCESLAVFYKNQLGIERHKSFSVYFEKRNGKVYFSRLIDGWIDEDLAFDPNLEQDFLTIENKNITQYEIRETDYVVNESFQGLNNLLILRFPAKYTQMIQGEWFYDTPNLIEIDIDPDNPVFTSVDGVVYNKEMTKLIYYPRGKISVEGSPAGEFVVPSSVTEIRQGAFFHNTGLKKITLQSVEQIEKRAFYRMRNLEEISFNEGLKAIGAQAFMECEKLESISLPDSLETIMNEVFMGNNSLENVEISPSSALNSLGYGAFEGCRALSYIYLPDSLKKIANWTFQNCSGLQSIREPKNLEHIGIYAFRGCDSLEELEIKETVQEIRKGAFYGCANLNLIIQPNEKPQGWEKGWDLGLPNEYDWVD
ncbi:MAG: leucine-rich repeat protein [Bacillota bacterium]